MEGNYLKGIATLGQRLVLLLDLEATLALGTAIQALSPAEVARIQGLAAEPESESARRQGKI
jgi:hypothetical protein